MPLMTLHSSQAEVIHLRRNLRRVLIPVIQILRVRSPGTARSLPLDIVVDLSPSLDLRAKLGQAFLDLRRARRVCHVYFTARFLYMPNLAW